MRKRLLQSKSGLADDEYQLSTIGLIGSGI